MFQKAAIRGFTLLEVTLALALSAIVFMGLGYFVTWQGHLADSRHRAIVESQTARVVLDQMTRELHNVALMAAEDTSLATGNGASNSSGTTAASSTANSTASAAGAASTLPTSSASSNTSGVVESSSSSTASSAQVATTDSMLSGIYGTSTQVQIDTHFVPAFLSQLQATQDLSLGLAGPSMPDIQSVIYVVDAPQNSTPSLGLDISATVAPHLLRGGMPHASKTWQLTQGSGLAMQAVAQSFAPHVRRLEFWYFDGIQWLASWDMNLMRRLPTAMQILLWVDADDDSQLVPPAILRNGAPPDSDGGSSGHIFSTVVSFPVTTIPAGASSSSANSSSGTNSSSGSTNGTSPSNAAGSTSANSPPLGQSGAGPSTEPVGPGGGR